MTFITLHVLHSLHLLRYIYYIRYICYVTYITFITFMTFMTNMTFITSQIYLFQRRTAKEFQKPGNAAHLYEMKKTNLIFCQDEKNNLLQI